MFSVSISSIRAEPIDFDPSKSEESTESIFLQPSDFSMRLSQRQWLRCMNEDNFFTQEQQVGGPNKAPGTSVLGSQLGSLGTARVQGGWSINQRNSYPRRTHITGYEENNAGKMYKKVHSIIFGSIATTTLLTLHLRKSMQWKRKRELQIIPPIEQFCSVQTGSPGNSPDVSNCVLDPVVHITQIC